MLPLSIIRTQHFVCVLSKMPVSFRVYSAASIPPLLAGESDELRGWEAIALGRIGIKYVRSRDDLAWYLASLHTLKKSQWPTVIAGELYFCSHEY